jgi:hypothetical protein
MAINKVGSKGIEDGSVATADFAPGTVSSDKLQDNAVTNAKLTNSSVTLTGSSVSLGGSVSFNNKFVDWQSVITADGSTFNTAVSGQGYFIDTTSAAHTITLPASASIGDFIAIKDYAGTFATNNLTIARNGHNIQGVANDSLISTNRASLVLVYVDSTKGWIYVEESNVGDLEGPKFITATGGTVTTSGDYKIHSFTGDGCFAVTLTGGCRPIDGPSNVDYLVVAGGGAGGNSQGGGGGGGAGGYRESHSTPISGCYSASPLATPTGLTVTSTTYPVTVGGGGGDTGLALCNGNPGSNSIFSTITSTGGGGGGRGQCYPEPESNASPGGSGGGGGGANRSAGNGNTPPVSPPQGNNGGDGNPSGGPGGLNSGGGGGGAGASGTAGTQPVSGNGGNGVTTSISGSPVTRAGGGAGGAGGTGDPAVGATAGTAGSGGGGTGGKRAAFDGGDGTSNTGSGGGGGGNSGNAAGSGGKGIVVIRYKFQ